MIQYFFYLNALVNWTYEYHFQEVCIEAPILQYFKYTAQYLQIIALHSFYNIKIPFKSVPQSFENLCNNTMSNNISFRRW